MSSTVWGLLIACRDPLGFIYCKYGYLYSLANGFTKTPQQDSYSNVDHIAGVDGHRGSSEGATQLGTSYWILINSESSAMS